MEDLKTLLQKICYEASWPEISFTRTLRNIKELAQDGLQIIKGMDFERDPVREGERRHDIGSGNEPGVEPDTESHRDDDESSQDQRQVATITGEEGKVRITTQVRKGKRRKADLC